MNSLALPYQLDQQDSERNLRKIALTIYWLYHTLDQRALLAEVKSEATLSESQAPNCAIIDRWSNSTAPNLSSNSSQTARVQKFTSIVTETQSSDIQFFPEIIQYRTNQQPSSSVPVSHLYKVQTSCPTGGPLREPQSHTRAAQTTQIHCDENKCVDASLDSGGLDCITSQAKDVLKDYRGDTDNLRGTNIESESQNYTFHLHLTTRDKKSSASELTSFCPQPSELIVDNLVPQVLTPPKGFVIDSEQLKDNYGHSGVLKLPNSSDSATFHNFGGISEVISKVDQTVQIEESLSSDCYTYGKENFYDADGQVSAINLTVEEKSVMEECSSLPNQIRKESSSVSVDSDQFASTSKIEKVGELNGCGTEVHPIPHHSLTVTLSDPDPESSMSHQVSNSASLVITKDQVSSSNSDFELLSSVHVKTSMNKLSEITDPESEHDDSGNFDSQDDFTYSDKRPLVSRKSSFLNSIMQVADKHTTKASRPLSAPSRSCSSITMTPGSSTTLPSQFNGSELRLLREKQQSENIERQKRRANIEHSARAALQYSARRQSLKAMSLPRDHESAILLATSITSSRSGEDSLMKSSATFMGSDSSSACCQVQNSSTGRSTSMKHSVNEVKEASVMETDQLPHHIKHIGKASLDNNNYYGPGIAADELKSPSSRRGDTDDCRYIVEENDTIASLEQSQSLRNGQISQSFDSMLVSKSASTVPHTRNEERGRHRVASFSNKQIDSLLQTLRSLSAHDEEVEELNALEGMLKSNTFRKAKQVHDTMHSLLTDHPDVPKPVIKRAVPTAQLMRQHLHHHAEPSDEVNELRTLLRAPHVQAILLCHDKVSTHDLYIPDRHFHRAAQDPVDIILSDSVYNFQAPDHPVDATLPLSRDIPSCRKEDATIVFLQRTNKPLGCTFYKQEDSVFFGKLLKGCDAEASDLIREGDELLEVNGIPVIGKSTDEIITLMSGDVQPDTILALTIIPIHDDNVDLEYEPKYVKAHFNYNSKHDADIPCKALGLTFQKGDILEVSNHDDPEWWQARKVFDDGAESLPGLIPSRHLQQQREALIRTYPFASALERKKGIKSMFAKRRKKKIFYQSTPPSTSLGIGDEVPTYEDVVKLEPSPDLIRPLVLIGAPGVGRRTLIRKLLNTNTSRYLPVIQYTTRPIRPGEVNGEDYLFVSREEFECDIEQDRFLEYGELKGFYYGTAFSSIKKIMESQCVPVLELHPQALKKVRHSGLKPYIVFIASPRLERLHVTRKVASDKFKKRLGSTLQYQESTSQKVHTESNLQHLVQESYMIENQYGHYFDWVIINDDFQVAADMLKEVAQRVQDEPQWVPKTWCIDNF